MKTYVIGTGGVGGYFGGKLARAGNDVTFVARGEFYNTMHLNGLVVNTTEDNFVIKPVQVIDDINKITNPDLILITVKTYDTQAVMEKLRTVITPKTVIVTFQNGIDNDLRIGKYLQHDKVFPGIAYVISSKTDYGVITQTGGLKRLVFGARTKEMTKDLTEIANQFREAQIDTILSEDIERDLWKKFIFINAFAGFTAICRTAIGDIRSDNYTYALYKECVTETILVARSLKIDLPETILEDTMKLTANTASDSKSSLLIDIENNRQNETESLNGTLVRIAEKQGISVPITKVLYTASRLHNIKLLESKNHGTTNEQGRTHSILRR